MGSWPQRTIYGGEIVNRKFGKHTAKACIEQTCERLKQYARELPDDKLLTMDELTERITLTVLYEMSEPTLPVDQQEIIAAAMGMVHACMQTIAMCNAPNPPNTSEIIWDDTVH